MILAELRVRTVKTHPPGIVRVGAPLFPFLISRVAILVVVVKRPLVSRPTVVGLPGHVAALEEQIAGAIIAHDEDDVALHAALLGSEFAQIDAAQPIVWNLKFYGRFPLAFAQTVFAYQRIGLGFARQRIETLHETTAGSAVVTRAEDFQIKLRHWIRAHHDLDRVASATLVSEQ